MELKGLYSGCSLFRVGIYSAPGKDSEKREVYSLSYTVSIPLDTLSAPHVPPTPPHPQLRIANQNWSRNRNRRSFCCLTPTNGQGSQREDKKNRQSLKVEYEHMVQNIPTTPRAQATKKANIVSSNPSLFLCPNHWGCHKTTVHLSTRKLRFARFKNVLKSKANMITTTIYMFLKYPTVQQLAQGCEPMSEALFLSQTK